MRRFWWWFTCWDRSWNAYEARMAAQSFFISSGTHGGIFCPCGKHKGEQVPNRVRHIPLPAEVVALALERGKLGRKL